MADFSISQFAQKVQDFINENKIDKNGDQKINSSNGELAALLSGTGAESVDELLMGDSVQFGNTTPPQKTSSPTGETQKRVYFSNEQIATLKNIEQAVEKYQTLSPDEQETVRENTAKGLKENFMKLYNTPGIGIEEDLKTLTHPQVEIIASILNGVDAETLEGMISQMTKSSADAVTEDTFKKDFAFREYDFMHQYAYTTTKDDEDGEITNLIEQLGGVGYTIAAKVRDAGDKFKQQVLAKFAEGSLTPEEFLAAYNKYNGAVNNAYSEIREITDRLLNRYEEELEHNAEALHYNDLNDEGFVDIKGGAAMKSFADAVNDLEDSGAESLQADQKDDGPKKYIDKETGVIYIKRGDEKYDMSGRRIE